jgi:disulfide bond formation protein DsbB
LGLIAIAWLVSAGLGLHHVGVEQHWWAGPSACTSGASGANSIDELRAMLHAQQFVQCDQITWRLFGLSMTTYNFLVSLAASIVAAVTALRLPNAR